MKTETLNNRLIERIKKYGFKPKYDYNSVHYIFKNNAWIVELAISNCNVDISSQLSDDKLVVACRYQCRNIKDLDFLLTCSTRLPFYTLQY